MCLFPSAFILEAKVFFFQVWNLINRIHQPEGGEGGGGGGGGGKEEGKL